LVGGCVRDLLLGIHPKDYDIVTSALPMEVKRTINRAYIIGKRFQLVLVRREEKQFEVATFRREVRPEEVDEEQPASDNIFGSPEEDAQRRDFTINGLFYDPINEKLIDFAGGLPDLDHRIVRMIGDPMRRLVEDPIRILRALRLKHMIGFRLDPELRKAMVETAPTLLTTALPRRREEILKLMRLKKPDLAFRESHDMGILQVIAPTLNEALQDEERAEVFYSYLRQVPHDEVLAPGDLFGILVLAFTRAFLQPDPSMVSRSNDVLGSDKIQHWMREELGMFKFEQALTSKALHVEPLLGKRREFQAKGERRQRALLSNEAFPLALGFAQLDYFLSGEDFQYWRDRFAQLREEGPLPSSSSGPRRRRRPRRRRNGGKTGTDEVRS
jgi:poly(A) polymerase